MRAAAVLALLGTTPGCYFATAIGPATHRGSEDFRGTGITAAVHAGIELHFSDGPRPVRMAAGKASASAGFGFLLSSQAISGDRSWSASAPMFAFEGAARLRRFQLGGLRGVARFGGAADLGVGGSVTRWDSSGLMTDLVDVDSAWALSAGFDVGLETRPGDGPELGFRLGAAYRLDAVTPADADPVTGAGVVFSFTLFSQAPLTLFHRWR